MKRVLEQLFKNNTPVKSKVPVHIGEWFYSLPETTPNKDGNIVLIKRVCFGPLEVYEWGINADNSPFVIYQWCENEFLEDTSYNKTISWEELEAKLSSCIRLFEQEGLSEWKSVYEDVLSWLKAYKKKIGSF